MVLIFHGGCGAIAEQFNKDLYAIDVGKCMGIDFGGIVEGAETEEIVSQSFELVLFDVLVIIRQFGPDEEDCRADSILPPECFRSNSTPIGMSAAPKMGLKVQLELRPPFDKALCICLCDFI